MATFFNQATLSYNGNVVNSNITTGELLEVLSATKTAVVDTYSRNSEVTYIINIVNSGSIAYNNLTVTDDLGAYTFGATELVPLDYVDGSVRYFVNGVLQPAPTVTSGAPLVITGINVPAGGVATVVYAAETNSFAPLGDTASIVNTAVVSGTGISDITVTETITPENTADLTISKSLNPTTVTENGQLTYTFVIQNTGSEAVVVTDNAIVTDTFNPALNITGVTFNGTAWTSPANYTYSEATGAFATNAGQITVPAATYTQNPDGTWTIQPGVSTLTVTGTII
ncbi:MAG: hypothetical protein J6A05_01180 [Oscillospiraceae bacterium]|nr:hypothetical protein [Oscillospiraceae bacterium]